MKEQSIHSEIGASSMYRWKACPGSVRMSRGIKTVSSVYADEGTKAHEIAAHYLNTKTWPKDLPEDDLVNLRIYTNYIEETFAANLSEGAWILVEHRFDLSRVFPGLFGTADCVMYLPKTKTLKVIDLKWGQGLAVEVLDNSQLKYYGLGGLLSNIAKVRNVDLTIVQPRCYHKDGPIRTQTVSVVELIDFTSELIAAAKRTQEPDAPLNPGDHCHFCPASGTCPALHGRALALASEQFSPTLSYNPEKLSETLKALPMLKSWLKSVESFAYQEAIQGRIPPGFKLVEKRANRHWKDVDQELPNKICEALGLSPDEIYSKELKSPAQIEKIIGKAKAKKEALSLLVEAVSSGTTLAPEDDDRPQITNDPEKYFTKIES